MPGILPGVVAPYIDEGTLAVFAAADAAFYASDTAPGLSPEALALTIAEAGLEPGRVDAYRVEARRSLGDREADAWSSPDSAYGGAVATALSATQLDSIREALKKAFAAGPIIWPSSWTVSMARGRAR